jgi:hypothetical protein
MVDPGTIRQLEAVLPYLREHYGELGHYLADQLDALIAASQVSTDRGLDWLLGISLYHWMQAQIDVFEVVSEFGRPEDAARFQELLATARDIQRLLHDLQMSDPLWW